MSISPVDRPELHNIITLDDVKFPEMYRMSNNLQSTHYVAGTVLSTVEAESAHKQVNPLQT